MKTAQRLLLALPLLLSACVEQKVPIFFFGICAPPEDAVKCAFSETCDQLLIAPRPSVVTQVQIGAAPAFTNQLVLPLQLNNQLVDNTDLEAGRTNTHDAIVESYELTFSGTITAGKVTYPANGVVPAEGTTVLIVPVIPTIALAEIQAGMAAATTTEVPVVVDVVAKGRLGDGSTFETGTYQVSVDVFDAVFTGYACQDPTEVVLGVCPNVGQTASVSCGTP
jgi:hypothetical protein